jgi:DNA-binding CsgD family transcriptional regulator
LKTLTDRESEVLAFFTGGLTSKETASILNIRLTTVISHRKHIRLKLNAKNSTEAVKIAYKLNLLDPAVRHPHK